MCVLGQGRDILEFWDLRLESQANVDASLNDKKKNRSVVFNLRPKVTVRDSKMKETSSFCKKNAGTFPRSVI